MFGYVIVNKADLKVRDYEEYKGFYCGLCRTLKKNYGLKGQITLNYDMTFLVLLLTGLYESQTESFTSTCIAHPLTKQSCITDEFSVYAADMNILLTYYQCLDDWQDDKDVKKKMLAKALKKQVVKIEKKYPQKAELIKIELAKLSELEKNQTKDIDLTSGCFGRIMSCVITYKDDEWKNHLDNLGFYLGKYIYILDAYNDYEEDLKKGSFNALCGIGKDEEKCRDILTMLMAQCASRFEYLPIIEEADILKNIIYSGVWTAFGTGTATKKGDLDA